MRVENRELIKSAAAVMNEKNTLNPAVEWHEKILKRHILLPGGFAADAGVEEFAADSHLHSYTSAYGLPEKRSASPAAPGGRLGAEFELHTAPGGKTTGRRVQLKLTAMLRDWRKCVLPVEVSLNGKKFFSGYRLFENVCIGWPAVYFNLPPALLSPGKNIVEIANKSAGTEKENILYVNKIEIIEKVPGPAPGFKSAGLAELAGAPGGKRIYAGADTDDVKFEHDGDVELLLQLLAETGMGNYILFRPKYRRNYYYPPGPRLWKKLLDYCRDNGIFFRITSWPLPGDPFPPEVMKSHPGFQGVHVHESYLLMQTVNNPAFYEKRKSESVDKFMGARDAREAREFYIEHIKGQVEKYRKLEIPVSFGEPSQLVPYLPVEEGDVIQAEPVGNASLLLGGVRAAAKWKNVSWGAHIAVDWYLGFPHDGRASRRFRLLANLCFISGAEWVYAENSLLETNAFERFDREDAFCRDNRGILRDFCSYARLHPREGECSPPLGVVYGNLESMIWHPDDLLPELRDSNNWHLPFWGKWDFTEHLGCWKAVDGWMPPLPVDERGDNPSILKLFSGSPFGQVDVVPAGAEPGILANYEILAFLGWNTMTEELYRRLIAYVASGGVLYISGYHLDTRSSPVQEQKIFNSGAVSELAGADVAGPGESAGDFFFHGKAFRPGGDFRLAELKNVKADPLITDSRGNAVMLENRIGRGRVYFGCFFDFPSSGCMQGFNGAFLHFLGSSRPGNLIEYTKDINYSLWEEEGASRAYFINVDWKTNKNRKHFTARLWGRKVPLSVEEGRIRELLFNGEMGVSSEDGNLFIGRINRVNTGGYSVEIRGEGDCLIDIFTPGRPVKDAFLAGGKSKFSGPGENCRLNMRAEGAGTVRVLL